MLIVQVGLEVKSGFKLRIHFVGCLMLNVEIAMKQLYRPFRQKTPVGTQSCLRASCL